MSTRATLGRTLPDRPFVRLTDALTFALYGVVAEGGPRARVYLPSNGNFIHGAVSDPWVGGVIEIAPVGLLHRLNADAAGDKEAEFYVALAMAAANGTVRFYGERRGGPFTTEVASERVGGTPIPQQFFAGPVEFSIETGRIDIDPEGLDDEERDIIERMALSDYQGESRDFRGWGAVGVERKDFLRWLAGWCAASGAGAGSIEPTTSTTGWPPNAAPIYNTGAAGRPTSSQFVAQEIERRRKDGETLRTIGGEARALAEWLPRRYPEAPKMGEKTIKNSFARVIRIAINDVHSKKLR